MHDESLCTDITTSEWQMSNLFSDIIGDERHIIPAYLQISSTMSMDNNTDVSGEITEQSQALHFTAWQRLLHPERPLLLSSLLHRLRLTRKASGPGEVAAGMSLQTGSVSGRSEFPAR